jgi:hypothetical protein
MHARSPIAFYAAIAGLALCVSARPSLAQQALSRTPPADIVAPAFAPRADSTVTETPAPGPTADAARVAVSQRTTHELKLSAAAQRRAGLGQPIALMVVGGAALLTGLIIGDDAGTVIAVSGALVGLYGLYEYLQ